MQVDATYAGLCVEGEYEYEAPTGPTYSCGGTPGGTWIDLGGLCVDDLEGDWLEALYEYLSPAVARMARGWATLYRGSLPSCVERWLLDHYEEEFSDALCDAGRSWEPDYDEDSRYDD